MSYIVLKNGDKHYFGKDFTPCIETIAFALSNINRYTGHIGQYSVAEHCILVAEQLPLTLKLSGLLHDAPEAYIGDVSSPLKQLLPCYKELEKHYHKTIDNYFCVETENHLVKTIDMRMLITEAKQFGIHEDDGSWPNFNSLDIKIERLKPEVAESRFIEMYMDLTK